MKVLWIVSNFPNQYNKTAGVFFEQISVSLRKKGVDITILVLTPYSNKFLGLLSNKWDKYRKYPKFESVEGVNIYRIRYLAYPFQNYFKLTPYLMYLAIRMSYSLRGVDVINAHYAYPYGFVASLLSAKYKIPFVVTLHGDDVNYFPLINKRNKSNFINSIKNATTIQAVSKALAEKTHYLSGLKPVVINLGLNLKNPFVRNPSKIDIPVFNFIFVGSLTQSKGMHLIVRLLEENVELTNEKYSWTIIGSGVYKEKFQLFNNIKCTGDIANNEVIEYMKNSHLMVFPSLSEGMPHALKEAGSVALPVVASDVGGIPDLLGNGERGIIFKNNDYESFKTCLFKAISEYEIMLIKGNLLQQYIFKHYDNDKNVDQLIQVYKKLI
jgi:teichuronic acid biosynthesis glycosyltransferase TuaC